MWPIKVCGWAAQISARSHTLCVVQDLVTGTDKAEEPKLGYSAGQRGQLGSSRVQEG